MKKMINLIIILGILLVGFGCTDVAVKTDPKCENLTEDDLIGTHLEGDIAWAKTWCYSNLAEETGELGYCEKIRDHIDKETYNEEDIQAEVDSCYEDVARALGDSSICDKIQLAYIKDDCYYYMATDTYNEGLCSKISTTMRRGECIRNI